VVRRSINHQRALFAAHLENMKAQWVVLPSRPVGVATRDREQHSDNPIGHRVAVSPIRATAPPRQPAIFGELASAA
jgi:hypothetical protein